MWCNPGVERINHFPLDWHTPFGAHPPLPPPSRPPSRLQNSRPWCRRYPGFPLAKPERATWWRLCLRPVETVCTNDWQPWGFLWSWLMVLLMYFSAWYIHTGWAAVFSSPFTIPDIFCTQIHETSHPRKWIFDLPVYMLFLYSLRTSKALSVNIGLGLN